MYDTSPKILDFEKSSTMYGYKDMCWVRAKFTDPDTGEELIADFKLCHWYKPPSDVVQDIRGRLMIPIVTMAGRKS